MPVTATTLRADIYKLLDRVLETGEPLQVERNGKILTISGPPRTSIWTAYPPNPAAVTGDPDDIAELDWSSEWTP